MSHPDDCQCEEHDDGGDTFEASQEIEQACQEVRNGLEHLRIAYRRNDHLAFADFVDVMMDDFGLPNILRAIADRERERARSTRASERTANPHKGHALSLTILSQADEIASIANRIEAHDEEADYP